MYNLLLTTDNFTEQNSIELDLPGYKNINLKYISDFLYITAERHSRKYSERVYFPNKKDISATYKDGVLRIKSKEPPEETIMIKYD